MEELICGRINFVFNAFLYLEPVQRSENMVSIGGPGSSNQQHELERSGCVEGELTAI